MVVTMKPFSSFFSLLLRGKDVAATKIIIIDDNNNKSSPIGVGTIIRLSSWCWLMVQPSVHPNSTLDKPTFTHFFFFLFYFCTPPPYHRFVNFSFFFITLDTFFLFSKSDDLVRDIKLCIDFCIRWLDVGWKKKKTVTKPSDVFYFAVMILFILQPSKFSLILRKRKSFFIVFKIQHILHEKEKNKIKNSTSALVFLGKLYIVRSLLVSFYLKKKKKNLGIKV